MFEKLFAAYIQDKTYLANLAPLTIKSYEQTRDRWLKYVGDEMPDSINIDQFVIEMRKAGLSPVTCNISIRSFNAFLSWLHEKGKITQKIKIQKLKVEKRVFKTFTDEDLKKVVAWRPKKRDWRTYAMLCTLADTGIRVSELLSLQTEKVDFDNLLITVMGKGRKERTIPISLELRKVLWSYYTKHRKTQFSTGLFFCTRNGTAITYFNFYKGYKSVCQRLGLDPKNVHGAFHAFRRKFGRSYLQNGGNLLYLQRIFGHEDLQTTKLYIEVETADLQATHLKTSPLSRLK